MFIIYYLLIFNRDICFDKFKGFNENFEIIFYIMFQKIIIKKKYNCICFVFKVKKKENGGDRIVIIRKGVGLYCK